MGYRVLADLVMLVHFGFIVLVVVGPLLAWRWRAVLRVQIPAAVYALAIVVVGFTCPLTPLEQHFRSLAGEAGYEGGFVDRYIEGVIYPGSLTRVAQAIAALVMLAGYALIVLAPRHRTRAARRS
ncbi:MAG: DUF2784 domain-containing protein [Acidimicrobiales bacterium]